MKKTIERRMNASEHKNRNHFSPRRILREAVLIQALAIAVLIISCAARETEVPAAGTDAATSGTAAAASELERTPAADKGTGSQEQPPSGQVIASASRDDDTFTLVTDVNAERKFDVFVDTSTIQTIEGEVYSWSKLVFKEDQKDSDGLVYREVMISSAIDCAKNTYSYKSSKFYDALGKMVYMENIATNKSEIPAKSVSRHIADFVCGYDPAAAKKATTPAKSK